VSANVLRSAVATAPEARVKVLHERPAPNVTVPELFCTETRLSAFPVLSCCAAAPSSESVQSPLGAVTVLAGMVMSPSTERTIPVAGASLPPVVSRLAAKELFPARERVPRAR